MSRPDYRHCVDCGEPTSAARCVSCQQDDDYYWATAGEES